MIVTFEGGSDDIVEIGIGASIAKLKRDEVYVEQAGKLAFRSFEVKTPGGTRGVSVVVIYGGGPGGTWHVAYGQLDEDRALPPWAFTVEIAHGYSMRLVIDTIGDLVELVPLGKDR